MMSLTGPGPVTPPGEPRHGQGGRCTGIPTSHPDSCSDWQTEAAGAGRAEANHRPAIIFTLGRLETLRPTCRRMGARVEYVVGVAPTSH